MLIQHLKSSTYEEEEKITINSQEHHGEKTARCLRVPVKALSATSDDPSLITESHTGDRQVILRLPHMCRNMNFRGINNKAKIPSV